MYLEDLKEMLSDSLPKGKEKEEILKATDEELSKLTNSSKSEAVKIYRDYKKLKSEVKGNVNGNIKKLYAVSFYNDDFTKKFLIMLNSAYLLAEKEMTDFKEAMNDISKNYDFMKNEFLGFFGLDGNNPFEKYRDSVIYPIQELFEYKNSEDLNKLRKLLSEGKTFGSKKELDGFFAFYKDSVMAAQLKIKSYIESIFEKVSKPEIINIMPGVKVFFRILLGLAGVEKSGKGMKDDGTGIETNKVYNFDERFKLGKGFLALLTYVTMLFVYDYCYNPTVPNDLVSKV